MNDSCQSKLISVIIPARDEANSIGSLIPKIRQSLSKYPHEIVVIDDGSKDATGQIARSNGATVVSHGKNLGKGAAMKTGVENTIGSIIVFLDGDGAHDPQDIPGVIAPFFQGNADLVIGSRTLPESKVPNSPARRRLSNSLASFTISVIISLLLPIATLFKCPMKWIRITDCTSGFRAIKRDAWQKLVLDSHGFGIETEMIFETAENKLTITEVPISCTWDSHLSRLSIMKDGLKTLNLIARKLIGWPHHSSAGKAVGEVKKASKVEQLRSLLSRDSRRY